MAAACCEDLIQQSYHIPSCPSRFGLAESWSSFNSTSLKGRPVGNSTSASTQLSSMDLFVMPAIPSSLKGNTRFQHYEKVWKIIRSIKRCGTPPVEFENSALKFRAMQEVMEILFFESVIEELLIESEFYSRNINLHSNKLLVTIMAFDFQKYKCLFRPPRSPDGIPETLLRIAIALWEHRVKLNATWSRMRVTASAQNYLQLLPVKKLELYCTISTQPLYCRVVSSAAAENNNTWSSMTAELKKLGISFVSGLSQLCDHPSATILKDGVIGLSPDCRQYIYDPNIRQETMRMLFPQDLGSLVCIGKLTGWFNDSYKDIIITNSDKGAIASHISSLAVKESSKIFMFDVPPNKMRSLQTIFDSLNVKNVQMMPTQFRHADPSIKLFANVGIIFCNPPNSLTAVQQPIDYIMQEGDDNINQLLKTQPSNFTTLEWEQSDILSHALTFKQAEHIAYFTRSTLERENERLVKKAMEQHTDEVNNSDEADLSTWAGYELDSNPAFKHKDSNGFLCSFKPAPPKPAPSASEVITKAIKLGVLDPAGIEDLDYLTAINNSTTKLALTKKKSSKKRIFSQHDGIPLTFSAKQKVVQKTNKRKEITEIMKQPKPFL